MSEASVRAALVRELDVIGGNPAERFDRVTRLARELFHVPMAYLNVVDDATLHILTPASPASPRDLPADESFCAHVVLQDAPITVTDTLADHRFASLPAVQSYGIRFYAGAPVRVRGTRVGSVCVLDTHPRTFAPADVVLLRDLATWAGHILSEDITDPARMMPAAAFRPDPIHLPGYELAADGIAFDRVSGDCYDWVPTRDGVAITLADVMGKGPAAATLAASLREAFRAQDLERPAAAVMSATDEQIGPELVRAEAFATAFHAHLNATTGLVEIADAGHGIAMLIPVGSSAPRLLRSRDLPSGCTPGRCNAHPRRYSCSQAMR